MEKRILVPLDNTEISEDVIKLADEWAQNLDASLSFLHVINPSFSWLEEEKPLFEDRFEATVSNFKLRSKYEILFRVGKAYQKILEVQQDLQPVLGIMAAHSHTVLHRLFLGSNTDHVLHGMNVPLIVYKKLNKQFENRFIVPIDYTDISKQMVEHADELAQWQGAELIFLHIDEIPEYPGNSYMMESGFFRRQDQTIIEGMDQQHRDVEFDNLQNKLDQYIDKLSIKSPFQTIIKFGIPYVKIIDVQKKFNARMVMLAAHSHTVVGRMFMGSNTDYLVHHADCSLYVYKSKDFLD